MNNLALSSSSQVGKLCGFSSRSTLVTALISIHVKVAAHFTELSAPLMLHHDLLFPVCLFSSLSNCLVVSLTVMVLMSKEKATSSWLPAHKQTSRKVMRRFLTKSES